MKSGFAFLALFAMASGIQGARAQSVHLALDLPKISRQGAAFSTAVLRAARGDEGFCVVIYNGSTEPIFLRGHNGMIDGIGFEVSDQSGTIYSLTPLEPVPTAYVSEVYCLDPGDAKSIKVTFQPKKRGTLPRWGGIELPFPESGEVYSSIQIKATLDGYSRGSAQGVYSGRIESRVYVVELKSN
jgi:hypothetical protein